MNYTPLEEDINVYGISSAFHYTFQKDFSYSGEKHDSWEFVFVTSGKIKAIADDKEYIVSAGELICHKPMEFHNLNPYHSEASATIFSFRCDSEKMGYFENKILTPNQRQQLYIHEIVAHAEKFLVTKKPLEIANNGYMEKQQSASNADAQYIKNSIELLLLSLFSAKSTGVQIRANSYTDYLKRKKLTSHIKEYLKQNIGGEISLLKIAKEFSYSVSTIKTVFKLETGQSVIEYYNKLRLDTAKKLLLENEYSVAEISDILGFNSPSHFANFFKNKTGTTPATFAK